MCCHKMHLFYYLGYNSRYYTIAYFTVKVTTCSQSFPIKLTVRTFPPAENFSANQMLHTVQNSVNNVCYT